MANQLHFHLYNGGNCGVHNALMSVEMGLAMAKATGRELVVYYTSYIFNSDRQETLLDLFPNIPATFIKGEMEDAQPDTGVATLPGFVGTVFYCDTAPDTDFAEGRSPVNLRDFDSFPVLRTADHQTLSQPYYQLFLKPEYRRPIVELMGTSLRPSGRLIGEAHELRDVVGYGHGSDKGFDCVHVRRGDYLNVPGTRGGEVTAAQMIDVLRANKSEASKLLVLSDETRRGWFDAFKEVYKHVRFVKVSEHLSPVEQAVAETLIAQKANTFIGTMYSTMTARINQLRRQAGKRQSFRYLYSQHPGIELSTLGELIEQPFGRYEWNRLNLPHDLKASNNWWHRWAGATPDDRFVSQSVSILSGAIKEGDLQMLRVIASGATSFHQNENRFCVNINGIQSGMGVTMRRLHGQLFLNGAPDYEFQLFRQLQGGRVNTHCDSLAPSNGSRRVASILIYVNDDFEGGELTFPNLNLTIKPTPGTVIAYPILNEWNEQDPRFAHSAGEVRSGEKIMGYFSLRANG